MAKAEQVFPALIPSLVLTATHGGTTVVTKLYGEVTPERGERERKEVAYRAEQVSPLPPKRERMERKPFGTRAAGYVEYEGGHWSDPVSDEQTKPARRQRGDYDPYYNG